MKQKNSKDKVFKVRMTEQEIKDLKTFSDESGFKNASEVVRESLKAFKIVKEREPESDNYSKSCDTSCMLHYIDCVNKKLGDFDNYKINPIEFLKGGNEDKTSKLIEIYDNGLLEGIKEISLRSVYHDLVFNRGIDDNTEKIIKDIAIEILKKDRG